MKIRTCCYVGVVLLFLLSGSAGKWLLSRSPDAGLAAIDTVGDLLGVEVELEYAWGDEDSEDSWLSTFTEHRQDYVEQACEADIIVVGKATGALDVTYGTTGQEFEIQETIRGSLEAGNKAWIYMPYMLQVMDGEIVYREAVNPMQPQETYLLFLKEDILGPYRDELHFAPINGITPYLRTGFRSLASLPSDARKDIYDNWKEYDCFTANRKLAEARTAIAKGILDRI